jgi:predicted ATPase
MNLRRARFDDHWRRTFSRSYGTKLESISYRSLSCLSDGTIRFRSGINAIIGGNGVGKSTIVAAISEILNRATVGEAIGHSGRLAGSDLHAVVQHNGASIELNVASNASGSRVHSEEFSGTVEWLEPSYLALECCRTVHGDQNFSDHLEAVTPLQLDKNELGVASYLVGKRYDTCEIFEISDYGNMERFPYFRVTNGEVTYGSEGMGQGELALLLLYWVLKDIPNNSILIIEEPETHVSPRSQEAAMNLLAKYCDEKGLWAIVTTHSPAILKRIPREHIRMIAKDAGRAIVRDNATNLEIALLLDTGISYRGVILVEDNAAKTFLISILDACDPDIRSQFEIVVAGSDGDISAALRYMPKTTRWFNIVGVYDGDVRQTTKTDELRWPAVFLPGDSSPEELLIEAVHNLQTPADTLSAQFNKGKDEVTTALGIVAGIDHHDWIGELSRALMIEYPTLIAGLVKLWLSTSENHTLANQLCTELRSAINNIR